MPSPPDPHTYLLTAHNQAALEELTTAIEFSQGAGAFTLLLVRCNYRYLQRQMVAQVVALLAEAGLDGPVHVLELQPGDDNLYARIQATINGELPGAVMVVALNALDNLDNLLVEVNKRREEFRRNFHFPLVLWLNDDSYGRLQTLATDFESIAGGETIEFTLSATALSPMLHEGATRYFDHLLQPDIPASFQDLRQGVDLGDLQPTEVNQALAELETAQGTLDPDLQTSVNFARALDMAPAEAIPLLRVCADYWATTEPPNPLRQALALFYLGQAQYHQADQARMETERDWQVPRHTLEQCQQVFTGANRPDLAAKVLTLLGRTLQKLNAWEDLETLAHQAIPLHQRYGHQSWLAQDYGFLARSALKRQQWHQAKEASLQGLTVVDQLSDQHLWLRQLYHVFLAQAEEHLGHPEDCLNALHRARDLGDQGLSSILVMLYQSLQRQYRQRGRYLEAFEAKQQRLTVEQQYGLRAFVGARRLRAQRQELDPEALSPDPTDSVAPEIESSGRRGDLDTLLNRLSRSDSKLIVLHGASGVGKSSLVNGGLVPALQRRALENRSNLPLLMRQYANWAGDLEAQLTQALGRNRRWAACVDTTASTPRQRILNTLQRCETEKLRPVLVFDQFEEFFFSNPDRLARRQFFQFVANCLDLQPSALKVVFSLREDYIHYLLEAKQLVKRSGSTQGSMARSQLEDILSKQVLYEIGNFDPTDAHQIIETLTERSRFYLEPDLTNALVQDLAGELQEVRPIEMQIVGAQLQTEGITTLAQYRQLGHHPTQTLVQRYLQDVVEDCGDHHRQLAELVLFLLTDERSTRPLKTKPELRRELEALGIEGSALVESSSPESPLISPLTKGGNLNAVPPFSRGDGGIDLVLRILTGSGIVVHLPDTPDDRYQLVHDYLAEVVRQQQGSQLEKLVADLEEEKRQRRRLEEEKTALAAANTEAKQELAKIQNERQDLRQQNKQARRVLAGTVVAGVAVAALTGGAAITSTLQARSARAEALSIQQDATSKEREADLNLMRADYRVGFAGAQAGVAARRSEEAIQREQQAQQEVETAEAELAAIDQQAKQEQAAAQAAIQHAEEQVAEARVASAQAQVDLAAAKLARAEALEDRESARYEAALVRQITDLERASVTAIQQFQHKETESLLSALKQAKQAYGIYQENGLAYLAASPFLALQTGLNKIRETWLFGSGAGLIEELIISPDNNYFATVARGENAGLWDFEGNPIASFNGYDLEFSPDGSHIITFDYVDENDGNRSVMRLWNSTGDLITELDAQESFPFSDAGYNLGRDSAFSFDGKNIIAKTGESVAKIWDLSGKEIATIGTDNQPDLLRAELLRVLPSPKNNRILTFHLEVFADREMVMARLWDTAGNLISQWPSSPAGEFSPNGEVLASAYLGNLHILDLKGNKLNIFEGPEGLIEDIYFSPDGAYVISVDPEGLTILWNLEGEQITTIEDIYYVAFNNAGTQFATLGRQYGTVSLWSTKGEQLATIQANNVHEVLQFSPSDSYILGRHFYLYRDGAEVWDLEGNKFDSGYSRGLATGFFSTGFFFRPDEQVASIHFNPGSPTQLIGLQDNEIFSLSLNDGEGIDSLEFSSSGKFILALRKALDDESDSGIVQIMDLHNSQVKSIEGTFEAALASPAAEYFSTLDYVDSKDSKIEGNRETAKVRIWGFNGSLLSVLEGSFSDFHFSPDGKKMVTSDIESDIVRIWDLDGNQITEINGSLIKIRNGSMFSPNGQLLAIQNSLREVEIWSLEGVHLSTLNGFEGEIWQLTFSPNSQLVAVRGGQDITARVWDLEGEVITTLVNHLGEIDLDQLSGGNYDPSFGAPKGTFQSFVMSFSPDSRSIMIAGLDNKLRIWDLNGNEVASFFLERFGNFESGQDRIQIQHALFSPSGEKIVVSYWGQGEFAVWDLKTKRATIVEGHLGNIGNIQFSPTGNLISTQGQDNTTRIWTLDGQQLAQYEGVGPQSKDWSKFAYVSYSDYESNLGLLPQQSSLSVFPIYTLNRMDELLAAACKRLTPYLTHNPDISDEDRALCGIPPRGGIGSRE